MTEKKLGKLFLKITMCFLQEASYLILEETVFFFLGLHPQPIEVPRLGGELERPPTPQPQQHRVRAASATYTTAHDKARSLTH